MKRWVVYCCGIAAVIIFGLTPFQGTKIGDLQPIQLIRIGIRGDLIRLETDTMDWGEGKTVEEALNNLKQTSSGRVFLETADFLLVKEDQTVIIDAIAPYLRPSCGICVDADRADLKDATEYLGTHEPQISIRNWKLGERNLPALRLKEGRMRLEE